MRKKFLVVIALIMAVTLGTVMTGCGKSFDPCAYVNGQMELLQTGKASEEAIANTVGTKEELEKDYQNAIKEFADAFFEVTEGSFEDNEENRAKLKEVFTALMSSIKYTVSDEYTEKDGSYFVDIEVEGSKVFDEKAMSEWAEDWMMDNLDMISDTDKMYKAFWPAYCDYMIEKAPTAGNKEAKTVTVEIKKNEDSDYYEITQKSIDELLKAMFGF